MSRANLFLRLDPLCVLPDCYLRLPDLVEHGCYGGNLSNYVPVCATSCTSLICTVFPTCMFPFVSDSPMTPLHCYGHAPLISYATCPFSSSTSTLSSYAPT